MLGSPQGTSARSRLPRNLAAIGVKARTIKKVIVTAAAIAAAAIVTGCGSAAAHYPAADRTAPTASHGAPAVPVLSPGHSATFTESWGDVHARQTWTLAKVRTGSVKRVPVREGDGMLSGPGKGDEFLILSMTIINHGPAATLSGDDSLSTGEWVWISSSGQVLPSSPMVYSSAFGAPGQDLTDPSLTVAPGQSATGHAAVIVPKAAGEIQLMDPKVTGRVDLIINYAPHTTAKPTAPASADTWVESGNLGG